jgi:hypothetical protein
MSVFAWHRPLWREETRHQAEPAYEEYIWVYLTEHVAKYFRRLADCRPGEVNDIG